MPIGKAQIVAGAAGILVLLLAVYFLYVGNVEAGTGAGLAAAAAVAGAKARRSSVQEDVQKTQQDVHKRKEGITAILDEYEKEQQANKAAIAAADVEEKRQAGLEALSPETRAALGMNDTAEKKS